MKKFALTFLLALTLAGFGGADELRREQFNLLAPAVKQATGDIADIEKRLAEIRRRLEAATKAQEQAQAPKAEQGNKDAYLAAYAKAVAENKPLVVWVACDCPPCRIKTPGYVHVKVDSFVGVNGAGVVVGLPRDGHVDRVADFVGLPAVESIMAAAEPRTAAPAPVQQAQFIQQQPQPQPFLGGFRLLGGRNCVGNS